MHASLNVGYQGKTGPGKIHEVILVSVKIPGASFNGLILEPQSFRTRTSLGDRSFQVAAAKLWNGLRHEIRSIYTFKRHLKTRL